MPKLIKDSKLPSKSLPTTTKPTPTKPQTEYSRAIYIDPGDRWVGMAIFERDEVGDFWECTAAVTIDLEGLDALAQLEDVLSARTSRGELDILGYEVYRLYEDKAQQQKGNEFQAVQLIGVIKHIARRNAAMNRWPRQPLELVRFLPDHKKATAGIMRKRGYVFMSRTLKTKGDHAWDAELQGIYDLEHNRGWKVK